MSAAELLELGTKPIRPDAPAGESARDDPEFEQLQNEIRKLELPSQPDVDWRGVCRNATKLLGTRSKDMLIAAYLCVGLYESEGFGGLANGLTVFRDMVAGFWEDLYPEKKRMRGRAGAVEWLGERGGQRVARGGKGNGEDAQRCVDLVNEIGAALDPLLDQASGLLSELRRTLEEEADKRKRPAPAPAAAAAPASGGASGGSAVSAVGTPEELDKALLEVRRLAMVAGSYLRESDPTNPAAYRLPRFGLWLRVKDLPPNQGGQTQIPPVGDFKAEVQGAAQRSEWKGVIQRCEDKMPTAVFWLDLHRFTDAALEALGPEYAKASEGLRQEVGLFLRRLPGAAELRFADGSPVADGDTRAWIQAKVLTAFGDGEGGAPAPPASGPSTGDDAAFQEAKNEAWSLARKKQIPQALRLLEEGAARGRHFRDRAPWKLEMARILIDRGQFTTAEAQLEMLDLELQGTSFADWNPELGTEVLKNLYLCRQKGSAGRSATPDDAARTREILNRLVRLDLVAAMELNGRP